MPAESPTKQPVRGPTFVDRLVSVGFLSRPALSNEPPRPGETRIRWVAGYFRLWAIWFAFLSVVLTGLLTTARGRAAIIPEGYPFLATGMAILFAIGFANIARLIQDRSRKGGFLAIGLFATDVVWGIVSGPFKPIALAISIFGVVVLGSVWKYLDDYEP